MTKIYISSTYSDLVEHRKQVYDILRKMRYDVIAMEDYVATDKRPLDKCLADVAFCDLYVGIFAWRYGYIPPDQERSITELEYRKAGEVDIPRLIFLLDEGVPWPRNYMDEVTGEGERGQKVKALRQELMAAHTLQFFKTPEGLAGQVSASVAEWARTQLDADMDSLRARRDRADKERREMHDRQRVVNLRPLDVAHFRDRLREMRALCDHLADSSVRLVSVVGRGGMGKTALVSRVLADLEQGKLPIPGEEREIPIDGILYLSARSTGLGLERIYTDVGRMLGEPTSSKLAAHWADRDTPLAAKVEYLLETMQDGLHLILLDMLEDYLSDDGEISEEGLRLFVERCLTQPDGVRLIVTSREEVKITAAALHSARSIPLREGLPEDEAVALLRDLDPQGTLGLHDAPDDDLRRAARLARGIPRALEILAGILHEDPTASLPKLLGDEATFDAEVVAQLVVEAYRRLGEGEQRAMEALAVFDQPVAETAIDYLLHPWFPGLDVRACLRCLVRGYFVSVNRVTGEYNLHPLDRDYAYHQMPDPPDKDEVRDVYSRRNLELRAADFYASIYKPESEWKTIDDLAPQLAEFEHRIRAGDYDGACRVLEPIGSYLYLWGYHTRLIESREKLLGRLVDLGLRAVNLRYLGATHRTLGHFEQAIRYYEQGLAVACEIGDHRVEGETLGGLGLIYRASGQIEQAIKFYEKALTIAREIGDRQMAGIQLGHMGTVYFLLGQVERAIRLYEEALTIARGCGDRRREGGRLNSLGNAQYALGQVEKAIKLYDEALAIAREIGDRRGEANRLENLGNTHLILGQVEKGIKLYEEALVIARETDHRHAESYRLLLLSKARLATGEFSEARGLCTKSLNLNVPRNIHQAVLLLGIVFLYQRDAAAGETFADAIARCHAMLEKTEGLYKPRYALAAALVGQAVCDPRWAEESERTALLAPALEEYQKALETCDALGVVRDALRDLELIRAAGMTGLEPAFGLLGDYVGERIDTADTR